MDVEGKNLGWHSRGYFDLDEALLSWAGIPENSGAI